MKVVEAQARVEVLAAAAPRRALLPILLATLIFTALSVLMNLWSSGFLEEDGRVHYLMARFAFAMPTYFTDVWGRPIATLLYAPAAATVGLHGVRLTSLVIALLTALVTWRIAVGQGAANGQRYAALAFVFTLAQPLVYFHSFAVLTELPFALLFGLAFWCYQKRWFAAMAVLAAVSPAARPEGFGVLLLASVALLAHRRWWWLPILSVGLLAWDLTGWHLNGGTDIWYLWLPHNWPYSGDSLYDRDSVFKFTGLLPALSSPFLFPAMLAGIWLAFAGLARRTLVEVGDGEHSGPVLDYARPARDGGALARSVRTFRTDHLARCATLSAVLPLGVLAVHSVLSATGKMASNGELRYLLTAAPFWAILSSRGWAWACDRLDYRRVYASAGAASLAVIGLFLFYPTLPLRPQADSRAADRVAGWYQSVGSMSYPHLISAHPGVAYALDVPPMDSSKSVVKRRPAGTVLVFDPVYSVYNSDKIRSLSTQLIEADGWRPLDVKGLDLPAGWVIYTSGK